MPAKIRLARHGKKHHAYYHIVVADSRAPRDGKFIELIGNYDPHTNPATINIDHDKALSWLKKGAQPTDTCRAILSYKGIMFKSHLDRGVTKGLMTQEDAEAKFQAWTETKVGKIEEKKNRLKQQAGKSLSERMDAETKKREAMAEVIRIKNTPPPAEEAPAAVAEATTEVAEATTEVAAEATPDVAAEAPSAPAEGAEGTAEAPAAE